MRNRRYTVPPLDPLLAFEAAARNLSFTKAAAELSHRVRAALAKLRPADEADEAGEPTIATYHSYAGNLIAEHVMGLPRHRGAIR